MPTIRNPADLTSLKSRFTRLTPASQAAWGKFTASAMICHLGDSLRVALGEVRSPFVGSFLTRTVGKWLVINTPVRPPPGKIETAWEMLMDNGFPKKDNLMSVYTCAHIGIYGKHTQEALNILR